MKRIPCALCNDAQGLLDGRRRYNEEANQWETVLADDDIPW